MSANGSNRSKDEQLAIQLARGLSIRAVAEACGCSERTIARRLKEPSFCRRLAEIRVAATERAINSLTDAATEAVDTLRKLLSAESEQVQLGAGKAILDSAIKYREREWGQRLDANEAAELVQSLFAAVKNVVKDDDSQQAIGRELQQTLAGTFS